MISVRDFFFSKSRIFQWLILPTTNFSGGWNNLTKVVSSYKRFYNHSLTRLEIRNFVSGKRRFGLPGYPPPKTLVLAAVKNAIFYYKNAIFSASNWVLGKPFTGWNNLSKLVPTRNKVCCGNDYPFENSDFWRKNSMSKPGPPVVRNHWSSH